MSNKLGNVEVVFIFIHIPKNAGSSIVEAMGLSGTRHYTASKLREHIGWMRYYFRFTFAFVRNPWDRFLSLYYYARLKESRYHSAINPKEAPHGKHEDYDLLKDATVEQCAYYLEEGRLQHDDHINHWRPQSDWLTDDRGQIIVDFIGRVETMDEDFQTIARRLDLSAGSLPIVNQSRDPEEHSYEKEFTENARRIVTDHYQEDIRRFGYSF